MPKVRRYRAWYICKRCKQDYDTINEQSLQGQLCPRCFVRNLPEIEVCNTVTYGISLIYAIANECCVNNLVFF